MEKEIYDTVLGFITLRLSARASRYSLKISGKKITAIMPLKGDEQRMLSFIEENREKLIKAIQKQKAIPLLNEQSNLQTTTFRLHIFRSNRNNFYMTLENNILHIACPQETNFEDKKTQHQLSLLLEKALRHEAKRLLPQRIKTLSQQHGFVFNEIKINNSQTHWGSCSSKKNISLSLSLMLLPWFLIDYVLLHELCHTVEMNHSDSFWELMNQVTDNKALALRQRLKQYAILKTK